MKICSTCNKHKKIEYFYFRILKNANNESYKYYLSSCKECYIKKAKKNYKSRTPKQVLKYAKQKNIKRKAYRRKKSAKKLGLSYKNYLILLKEKKEITKKRKLLNTLKTRLNKYKPKSIKKDSQYYKKYFQIFDNDWFQLTKDNPKESTLIYRIRYKYDTKFNLKERLRSQLTKQKKKYPNLDYAIRQAVSINQNTKYFDILGYTKEELKNHLEKQFTKGMNWKLFRNGNIHIDHIKPQSLFNLKDINDIKECWSLNNLQPLWAKDNIKKRNKYKGEINE